MLLFPVDTYMWEWLGCIACVVNMGLGWALQVVVRFCRVFCVWGAYINPFCLFPGNLNKFGVRGVC